MSRFTPETRATIVAHLRSGLSFVEACERAAVPVDTGKGWLKRGRREDANDSEYTEFVALVDQAREDAADADMDDVEFVGHLNQAVRRGSVAAMKLWWSVREQLLDEADGHAMSELDELDAESAQSDAGFVEMLAARCRRRREPDSIDVLRAQRAARRARAASGDFDPLDRFDREYERRAAS